MKNEPTTLLESLGIEVVDVNEAQVVCTMPVGPRVHQPFGYLHGGATVALAETVASIGANGHCPAGKRAFGLEINTNHLRSKRDGIVRAVGTPIHLGQTTQVWQIQIYDETERLMAISRCTLAVVDARR